MTKPLTRNHIVLLRKCAKTHLQQCRYRKISDPRFNRNGRAGQWEEMRQYGGEEMDVRGGGDTRGMKRREGRDGRLWEGMESQEKMDPPSRQKPATPLWAWE